MASNLCCECDFYHNTECALLGEPCGLDDEDCSNCAMFMKDGKEQEDL